MGVTSNYSFPVPVATDLVKDGWDAINDLGVAVDTAMNTALGTKKAGMVLLNTTSFSGVASQAAPTNTFTSTYRNYKIILSNMTCSVNNTSYRMRLRIAGVDTTTTTYTRFGTESGTSSLSNNYASSTNWYFGNLSSTATVPSFAIIDLFNPQVATRTQISSQSLGPENNSGYSIIGFQSDTGSQFDSFNIFADSGNISGTMQIFGYNA